MSDHVLQLAHLRDPRAQVIHVLAQIQQGASLSSLTPALFATIDESNRAFSHELLYGTLRQWWALSRIIESLATRSVEDPQVIAALHIGLYQLLYLDTPDYAAVNSTLEALKTLDGARATGFVNAILRKVQKSVR
ncbi:transcription antitermination factor NusB [Faucicola atlantae]|uniref:transcription antitermination factor NusB n=1 Tax=Faucicola atlantae TaxID=34059 RepID=UPI0025B0CA24|nr:transcription antitermination factor NusB [Moraxella atlantae]